MKLFSIGKIVKFSVWLTLLLVTFHAVYYLKIDPLQGGNGRNLTKSLSYNREDNPGKDALSSNVRKTIENEVHFQNIEIDQPKEKTFESNSQRKTNSVSSRTEDLKQRRRNLDVKGEDSKTIRSQSYTDSGSPTSGTIKPDKEDIDTDTDVRDEDKVSSSRSHSTHGTIVYDGHDLLKDPKFTFDRRFKNPCWYDDNQLKCLPYFFVIGVKKCGTSSVFGRACQFPDVIRPGFKEAQFFARRRFARGYDDIEMYIKKFDEFAKTLEGQTGKSYLESNKTIPYITGEGSPSNLHLNSHWEKLPGNENLSEPKYVILDYIKHFLPDAKLIITFRDPIERLYSDYYHEYGTLHKTKNPNPEHFHEIVVDGTQMYRDCFSTRTVRSCVYDHRFYDRTKIQIQLGIYFVFWQELLRVFPREQILVLQNKNLSSEETDSKIQSFLGLDPISTDELDATKMVYKRRPKYRRQGPMLNQTFELLYRFYKPFNEKMAALTGDDTFLYSHQT